MTCRPFRVRSNVSFRAPLVLLGSLMFVTSSWAQAAGAISGTVTDQDNRPLPGVTVTLTSSETDSLRRSTVTDVNGRYDIAALTTGTYTVAVALPGFHGPVKTQRVTGERREVWLVMSPAELRETLPVPARPPARIVPLSQPR